MSHWGEFKDSEDMDTKEEVIPVELVKSFIMKAMQQDNYKNVLPHNPLDGSDSVDLKSETTGLEIDDRVLHTIKLLQHAREMNQLIEAAREQIDVMADSQLNTSFPPALDIPEHPIPPFIHKFNIPFQYINKEYSDFGLGRGEPLPEISKTTAQKLLKKSVAALLAHAGYATTTESILDVVTDVAEEYMKKMSRLLRMQVDQGSNITSNGFPDAMERLFHDMNIGSVRVVGDYYNNKVIKYHETVLEECQSLNSEYNQISIPINILSNEDLSKLVDNDDVPEIHFPALGDGDGVDKLQPSLEPGFQMLHNLEQQVHLQSLDDDKMNILADMPSMDQDGFIAKKRKRL